MMEKSLPPEIDWYKVKIFIAVLLTIALVFLCACVSRSDYDAVQTKLQNSDTEIHALRSQLTSLQTENAQLKSENTNLTAELNQYKQNFGMVNNEIQPPYVKDVFGSPISLIRDENTRDPTWLELKQFLGQDRTDQIPYSSSFRCGNFAERVYNNAESRGIRAAFVVVRFHDGSNQHALNAFYTRDMGIIYTDSTGIEYFTLDPVFSSGGRVSGNDKVAYVQVGKPLGFISLESVGTNYGLKYSDYEQWQRDKQAFYLSFQRYNSVLASYNARAEAYNNGALSSDPSQYTSLTSEMIQLINASKQLDSQRNQLGVFWSRLPVVKKIEIYW